MCRNKISKELCILVVDIIQVQMPRQLADMMSTKAKKPQPWARRLFCLK